MIGEIGLEVDSVIDVSDGSSPKIFLVKQDSDTFDYDHTSIEIEQAVEDGMIPILNFDYSFFLLYGIQRPPHADQRIAVFFNGDTMMTVDESGRPVDTTA